MTVWVAGQRQEMTPDSPAIQPQPCHTTDYSLGELLVTWGLSSSPSTLQTLTPKHKILELNTVQSQNFWRLKWCHWWKNISTMKQWLMRKNLLNILQNIWEGRDRNVFCVSVWDYPQHTWIMFMCVCVNIPKIPKLWSQTFKIRGIQADTLKCPVTVKMNGTMCVKCLF